jgi:hypothetical protein
VEAKYVAEHLSGIHEAMGLTSSNEREREREREREGGGGKEGREGKRNKGKGKKRLVLHAKATFSPKKHCLF